MYILATALFVANYHICFYFFPGNDQSSIDSWWFLKSDIYGLIILILFVASKINQTNRKINFVLDIAIGLTASNSIDRFFFNTTTFTKEDVVMILLTIAFAIYDFRKCQKKKS